MRLHSLIAVTLGAMMLFPGQRETEAGGIAESSGGEALGKPRVIYVVDFAIDPSMVQTSSDLPSQMREREGGLGARLRERAGVARQADSTNPASEASHAVDELAEGILSAFARAGVPAERIAAATSVPADCWLLRGEFQKLSEGNRLQQSVVGFGAGQPEVEVSGTLLATRAGTSTAILTFGEESQQHRMPGGIVAHNPYAVAARFALSRSATGRDVQQLGGSVASEIVSYMRANGLLK